MKHLSLYRYGMAAALCSIAMAADSASETGGGASAAKKDDKPTAKASEADGGNTKPYGVISRFKDYVASTEQDRPVFRSPGDVVNATADRAATLADRGLIERDPLSAEEVKKRKAAAEKARKKAEEEASENEAETEPRKSVDDDGNVTETTARGTGRR